MRKDESKRPSYKLFDHIFDSISLNLSLNTYKTTKDQRNFWVTLQNLKMWFDNWKSDLDKLSFTTKYRHREICIA